MRGCLPVSARIAAILLAVFFVLSLPLSLVAFNLGRVAFSPQRMTTLLVETIDETGGLRQVVINSLTTPPGGSEPGGLDLARALGFLTPQERDYLGEQLLPPGWAKAQLGSVVQGIYEWIDNDRARPAFVVDIAELKVALLSGGASELVETVVDSWPPCTVEEMAQMGVGALLGEQSLKLCEPPEPLRSGLVGLVNASLAVSLRALPDKITLGEGGSTPASDQLMQTKERIRRVRFLAGWSWLLSPMMLGLIMALVIRSWRDLGLWWGIPLLAGAMLTLAAAVGARVGVENLARSALADAEMPAWIAGMIHSMITAMMAVVFRRVTLQAGILLLVGLLILVGGLARGRAASSRQKDAMADREKDSQAKTLDLAGLDEGEAPEEGQGPSGMFG